MSSPRVKEQILEQLNELSPEEQLRVLSFARSLGRPVTRGVPGRVLLRFAGTLDEGEARRMEEAIEQGCERVDPNGW